MWQSIAYSLKRDEDWVVGLRPMIPVLPSKLGLRLPMWVLSQQPTTYLESGMYLSSRSSPVQHSEEKVQEGICLGGSSKESSSQVESQQDISEIADVIKTNALDKLLFCVEEPHGIDTRITLTTEECYALLSMLDARSVSNAVANRSLRSTGSLPKFAGVFYMQNAVGKGIRRKSHVLHLQPDDIRSRHF